MLAAIGLAAIACSGPQSWIDPMGPGARRVADLWWAMLIAAVVVSVAVLALLGYALWRRRTPAPGDRELAPTSPDDDRRGAWLILIGGGIAPAAIVGGLFILSLITLGAVHGRRDADLVVEIVGWQWWWEVRYLTEAPGGVFTTANELRIPVGQRVELRLDAQDVIHSFWVPALQGKRDLVPGRRTITWIQADAPGIYRGQCAEFCGVQHARMNLLVEALTPEEFIIWRERARSDAAPPSTAEAVRGQGVFMREACATCHTIRGTRAGGTLGPDLTHLASRQTLAAGTLPNTRGHLGGWIANPQELKPGALMPRVALAPDDLHALLDYLQTLR